MCDARGMMSNGHDSERLAADSLRPIIPLSV